MSRSRTGDAFMAGKKITTELVRRLIDEQFPAWRHLPLRPVDRSGHDNRTFRLGDELTVRLPSHERYAPAIEKEQRWLPVLGPRLSLPITVPVAKGEPTAYYPLPWSVNRWVAGEPVTSENTPDRERLAEDLAVFLQELQAIDAGQGPPAGEHNFHRGGNLAVYEAETLSAIDWLGGEYDRELLTDVWRRARSTAYQGAPVWVHGDVAVGNLLVKDGRLAGVIDFGALGTGDPACDLVMAWTFFDGASRDVFFRRLAADRDLIDRARGWALWKALITYAWNDKDSEAAKWGRRVLDGIALEYGTSG